MKYYKLLISSSYEILSLIAWDEIASGSITGSFTFPSGTYLEEVTSSYIFTASLNTASYIERGNYAGQFMGSIYASEFDTINVNDGFYVYSKISNDVSQSNTGSVNVELTGSFVITGSLILTGSVILTGSFYGDYTGSLKGTASYAEYAKFAETGSQIEIIEKSKNWTAPSWAKKIKIVLVGGGGGGGYAPADEDGITPLCGGGGGAGGTITFGEFRIEDLTTGSIPITIGASGIGGGLEFLPGEFSPATNGGDTLFGDYLIAPGGMAGASNAYSYALSINGGISKPLINLLNTGGGPGGRGTCFPDANDPGILVNVPNHSIAPGLPIDRRYVENILQGYIYPYQFPLPIPASIAPTGGGGGLGYNPDDGGRYGDGVDTWGGSILENVQFNRPLSVTPIEYNSSSYEYYPAFNTKVGLGGKGGNGYLLSGPTHGTDYGGGGGGAFAGGVTGSYPNGDPTGNNINVGANGGRGVAIIISET